MERMAHWSKLMGVVALALAGFAQAAPPQDAVGMVLDVQGGGEVVRNKAAARLQLLSYVHDGAQLKLDAGARASVSHYKARLIYQLAGPAVAQIDGNGLRVVSGKPASTKSLAEKVVNAAINPNLGAAAFKMRALGQDVALQAPLNRSVLLGQRPRFQWNAGVAGACQVTLSAEDDKLVARGEADGAWELPAGSQLEAGKDYRWSVACPGGGDAPPRTASAAFSVATRAEADAAQALRPAAGAAVDEWVLYATLLRDRQMLDEARAVWREVAAQRPDLDLARSMAQ